MKKLLLVVVIVALVIVFFALGLNEQLTIAGLKASLATFTAVRDSDPLLVGSLFFLFFVVVTAISLPGSIIISLSAGALFGLGWGTLIASFASSIGATLAFLISRYLLHDAVQTRFADRLQAINAGMKRDGIFYLFMLRLIPVFPFFLVNLVMALTKMPALTFYVVSQVGMLADTIIFVNAGTQIAQITSVSGLLSPQIIVSLALLGIIPLLVKYLHFLWHRHRVYAGWKRPQRFDRNLVVVGAGAAGLVTSYLAAALQAKVTLVEAHKMGGDCLNYGCVPSKALIKTAKLAQQIRQAHLYGLQTSEPVLSFAAVMARVHNTIASIAPHDSVERYTELGVDVKLGQAVVIDPWTVDITLASGATERLTTQNIVIASGAAPIIPAIPGLEEVGYFTSETLWQGFAAVEKLPARIVILGGGSIGVEFAQAFARLGAAVTLIERGETILAREDIDVAEFAASSLIADGVSILVKHEVLCCKRAGDNKCIRVSHDEQVTDIEFDALICAIGRAPRLTGFGLEKLGIPLEKTVFTNDYLETLYPNIFTAGDVAGPYQFTHVAAHQAWYAAVNALFGKFKKFKVDYRVIPRTIFLDPEIARVGLNEREAHVSHIAYEVTRFDIRSLDRAIIDGVGYGFIKVLTVPGKDNILGATIVGEHAGDLLAEFVLAMKCRIGLNKILNTIHSYPTLVESNKYLAGEWKRSHVPTRWLRWLAKYHQWQRG